MSLEHSSESAPAVIHSRKVQHHGYTDYPFLDEQVAAQGE